MTYLLGIDLGTTVTAAAVCRRAGGAWGQAEVVPLGTRSAGVASVLFVDGAGGVLVGEAAERRVVTDPTRVVREFKRRIGDTTPLLVGGVPWPAHSLSARLARWVVDTVSAREGAAPDLVAVTHPAGWGAHRRSLLSGALRAAGLPDAIMLPEPQAAAICYASTERVPTGSTVAVYDLGGGTFDASVLRKSGPDTFTQLGQPVGHDRLGGLDFDELIFEHLRAAWPAEFAALDPSDPAQVAAVLRLRRECAEAKEALSEDTEVVIPVLLPGLQTQARLVRSEFEDLIRPAVAETVDLLATALRTSEVPEHELSTVLLVGGSARIPLVTELLSATLGRPVAVDADPKAAVSLGAVLALRTLAHAEETPTDRLEPAPEPVAARAEPAEPAAIRVEAAVPPQRPAERADPLRPADPEPAPPRRPRMKTLALIGGIAVAATLVGTITGLPDQLASINSPAHAATAGSTTGPSGAAAYSTQPLGRRESAGLNHTGSLGQTDVPAAGSSAPGATPASPRPGAPVSTSDTGHSAPTSPVAPSRDVTTARTTTTTAVTTHVTTTTAAPTS